MFSGPGVGDEVGSRVLDILLFFEMSGRKSEEEANAIVKSGSDECMDKDVSC